MAEERWKERRWVWAIWAGLPMLVMVPIQLFAANPALAAEGGILESAQAAVWAISLVSAFVVVSLLRDARCRWNTALLGVLAGLALAREWDAHILLNPETLGSWGVRYRLDWWTDPAVPLALKLGWAGAGLVLAAVLVYPAWRGLGRIEWRRARPRLFVAAIIALAGGFVFDDLLRGRIPLETAQLCEESVEFIGAILYLGAVLAPESSAAGPSEASGGRRRAEERGAQLNGVGHAASRGMDVTAERH